MNWRSIVTRNGKITNLVPRQATFAWFEQAAGLCSCAPLTACRRYWPVRPSTALKMEFPARTLRAICTARPSSSFPAGACISERTA